MSEQSKAQQHRARARDIKRSEILEWYLSNNHDEPPETQCEDVRANGVTYWWLEPPLPGIVNYAIRERPIGDGWGLEFVELTSSGKIIL